MKPSMAGTNSALVMLSRLHQVEDLCRIKVTNKHRGCAKLHAGQRPFAAGDVEQRHAHEIDGRAIEFPGLLHLAEQREQVGVAREHALGQAGGAARIELQAHVLIAHRRVGVASPWREASQLS